MRVERLDHVALEVADVARPLAWYEEVLGLERRFDNWIGAGDTWVALSEARRPDPELPGADALAMRHLALRIDRANFELAQAELANRGIEFKLQDHGVARAIYFRDPDGHELELTCWEV